MAEYRSASGSSAEDLFIELFADTFGAEKAGYLYSQYPFYDIYQNARFADFVLENGATRVAIEIDDQATHDPRHISVDKFCDDLLKQNSMVHLGWDIYRFAVRQMQKQPETVKDELRVFLGNDPRFKEIEDYLPSQQGKALDGEKLELREYQQEALDSLATMRANKETIALLYHATGTGKTVTAVMDSSTATFGIHNSGNGFSGTGRVIKQCNGFLVGTHSLKGIKCFLLILAKLQLLAVKSLTLLRWQIILNLLKTRIIAQEHAKLVLYRFGLLLHLTNGKTVNIPTEMHHTVLL